MSTPPPNDPYGGYGQNPGGYGPPPGEAGQNPGGYGPPQGGYGAPQGGYGAPQGGYGPPPPYPSGGFGSPPPHLQPLPNYLWQSITLTVVSGLNLLCCNFLALVSLAFAIVALVNSTRVEGRQRNGDLEGAASASKNAKTWSLVSLGVLVASFVLSIILVALGVLDFFAAYDSGSL